MAEKRKPGAIIGAIIAVTLCAAIVVGGAFALFSRISGGYGGGFETETGQGVLLTGMCRYASSYRDVWDGMKLSRYVPGILDWFSLPSLYIFR